MLRLPAWPPEILDALLNRTSSQSGCFSNAHYATITELKCFTSCPKASLPLIEFTPKAGEFTPENFNTRFFFLSLHDNC